MCASKTHSAAIENIELGESDSIRGIGRLLERVANVVRIMEEEAAENEKER